jgi:catechol 2,3-dioxygenase-like lactoylglutathione lyase family enzyme
VIDHVTLSVSDFGKALGFYRSALGALGFEVQGLDEAGKGAGFGPKDQPCLWIAEGKRKPALHIAFRSGSRAAVQAFHRAALAAGGKDYGAPGPRADYGPTYYAAFVIDPDGNNIEAVTQEE